MKTITAATQPPSTKTKTTTPSTLTAAATTTTTTTTTTTRTSAPQLGVEEKGEFFDELDDWIILDKSQLIDQAEQQSNRSTQFQTNLVVEERRKQRRRKQTAMDKTDIELIKTSWIPARTNPAGSGVLLFKGLFTKFPGYLGFFTQLTDLDFEQMHENKRLVKHAVKVIETVTFVVDSIGDETKKASLNEALTSLVKSHLKRKIGLTEFRNLGIVIIDFICDLNHRRANNENTCHANSNNNSSNNNNLASQQIAQLDVNLLVAAWTKLYGSILDLVENEEDATRNNEA